MPFQNQLDVNGFLFKIDWKSKGFLSKSIHFLSKSVRFLPKSFWKSMDVLSKPIANQLLLFQNELMELFWSMESFPKSIDFIPMISWSPFKINGVPCKIDRCLPKSIENKRNPFQNQLRIIRFPFQNQSLAWQYESISLPNQWITCQK